jgi:hypothetical protein
MDAEARLAISLLLALILGSYWPHVSNEDCDIDASIEYYRSSTAAEPPPLLMPLPIHQLLL